MSQLKMQQRVEAMDTDVANLDVIHFTHWGFQQGRLAKTAHMLHKSPTLCTATGHSH